MCDFTALSPSQRSILLSKFYNILKTKGSVLLDMYSLNFFNRKHEQSLYEFNQLNKFWSKDDYYCFLNTFKYEEEKVLLDKYTIYSQGKKRVVYNWLQCFNQQSVINEFDDNNLTITEFFSNVSGDEFNSGSDEFAVIAQKK